MNIIPHFIAGAMTKGAAIRYADVFNPAAGEITGRVSLATAADVDAAVAAAKNAFVSWSRMPASRRAGILFKFKNLLEQNHDKLAAAITREHGKVLCNARDEVTRGIEVVESARRIPHLLCGEHSDNIGVGIDIANLRQPFGVVAGITPFNFPVKAPMWMFPVALACGNTFVLKPSERDPSPSLMLASLLKQAGLPDGVFNVVQGNRDAVEALIKHSDVEALSYVGSAPIAQYIYTEGTKRGKRVQALGDAKSHLVIMPDANIELAVDALVGAAYGSAGERCMAITVAVAVGSIADELVEKLAEEAKLLKIGDGMDVASEMGPLMTGAHKRKVENYVVCGIREGAKLVVDGRNHVAQGNDAGFFTGATLFDHVTPQMTIYKEEIFGPVLCVVRVPDLADAIELINRRKFGNGTACFTSNGNTARTFARHVQIGLVGINVPIPLPTAWHSFGGWKHSVFGDHHAYGEAGVGFYTRYKDVMQSWPDSAATEPEFTLPMVG